MRDRIAQALADNSAGLDFRSLLNALQADRPVNERSLQSSLSRLTSAGIFVRKGRRYSLSGKETEKVKGNNRSVPLPSFTESDEPAVEEVDDEDSNTRRPDSSSKHDCGLDTVSQPQD